MNVAVWYSDTEKRLSFKNEGRFSVGDHILRVKLRSRIKTGDQRSQAWTLSSFSSTQRLAFS